MPVLSPVEPETTEGQRPVPSLSEGAATGTTDALPRNRFDALRTRRTGTFVTFAGEHPPRIHVTLVPVVPLAPFVTFRGRG